MRKIIHPEWELDISHILLNEVLENSFFSDNFFAKITYPFDLAESEATPQFIYHYNQSNFPKYYDKLILLTDGKLEECRLIILSYEKVMSFQLVIGFEDFPNFDKKLSELPLHKYKLENQTLYDFAESIINKKYPETDFNFPALHTDHISNDTPLFSSFLGTYNLRKKGKFVANTYAGKPLNYNLIQPFPYFLYLLKTGFLDAGYQLTGDILEDEQLQTTVVVKPNTFSELKYPSPVEWNISRFQYDSKSDDRVYNYREEQPLSFYGKFRVTGSIDFDGPVFNSGVAAFTYKGTILCQIKGSGKHYSFQFDFVNNPKDNTHLTFYCSLYAWSIDRNLLATTITPLELYNEDGSVFNPLLNEPYIDLTHSVPEITFGELVRSFKNTVNYDLDREQKIIKMNFLEKIIKEPSWLDMNNFDVKKPRITFNEDTSFLLKYEKENDELVLAPIYIDTQVIKNTEVKKENTQEIISPIIPLPRLSRNGIESAKIISTDESDIQIVNYLGLTNNENSTVSNTQWEWIKLYEKYWKRWLNFRLNADSFTWKFKAFKEALNKLTIKTKIRAYNRTHIIKKISRQDLSRDTEEIELETYSE